MFFHSIQTSSGGLESGGSRTTKRTITLDVGRTLALAVIGVVLIIVSAVLWLNHLDAPAAAVFAVGEAVVTGGFGIVLGEDSATAVGS
jgi:hypothetical protein